MGKEMTLTSALKRNPYPSSMERRDPLVMRKRERD